jgi:hypothetical protein
MAYIVGEGYRERVKQDAPGFYCTHCKHRSPLVVSLCPSCGNYGTFAPVSSPEKYHDQTKAIKDAQKVEHFSPGYDSTKMESQRGKMMLPEDLFTIIRAAISGLVVKQGWHAQMKRPLYKLYIPIYCKPEDELYLSDMERRERIQFVCGCEIGPMPEWDVIKKDEEGKPAGLVRGWRSVLDIFYRKGMLPWVPDDGKRKSSWTIKQSRLVQ